jgi:mannitol operon transcriptional antiterminator
MLALTTAQRELLQLLLIIDTAVSASLLGERLQLTARQVHYGLRAIRPWLRHRNASLRRTPGVGIQVVCTAEQRQRLIAELAGQSKFQLILTPGQRRQLLALCLLAANMPCTLQQLQEDLAVARATVLNDLEVIEPWLATFHVQVARRQHRGCWIDGAEFARRQALAALLWGDVPFDRPIMAVRSDSTIAFELAQDAARLPIIRRINAFLQLWDVMGAQAHIAWVEAELGARFTDEAIAPLALAVALQMQRAQAGSRVSWDAEALQWIQAQVVWPAAVKVGEQVWPNLPVETRKAEAAAFALQILCGARDEPWRHDNHGDPTWGDLSAMLLRRVATAYEMPKLAHDELLRAGLDTLILPAYARVRFKLWAAPRLATDTHTDRYAVERVVATQLAEVIAKVTGLAPPPDAHDELILLLRAAILRARPERFKHVLVVCPSGMATTQLLVARLRSRLPRLGVFEVLPMRELTAERIAAADLIISTVPLVLPAAAPPIDVLQVHPMLLPEDIVTLTQWMA